MIQNYLLLSSIHINASEENPTISMKYDPRQNNALAERMKTAYNGNMLLSIGLMYSYSRRGNESTPG